MKDNEPKTKTYRFVVKADLLDRFHFFAKQECETSATVIRRLIEDYVKQKEEKGVSDENLVK